MAAGRRKRMVVILAVWAIGVAAWAWYYVATVLAGPVVDSYARNIQFQLLMFAVFRLPLAFAVLLLAIGAARMLSRGIEQA